MTLQQGLAFGLVGATVLFFLWGRWRFDVIALASLAVGVGIGLIKPEDAFKGVANDIVIIIASALVLSAAVARSGMVDRLIQPFLSRLKDESSQVPFFAAATAVLSMATKNVGALALLMPSALGIARRTDVSPGRLLMPMSFASLVGGLAVLVGTSPNIIVAGVRAQTLGKPFAMFDFMPVGGLLTVLTLIYLAVAFRLLPRHRQPPVSMEATLEAQTYVTEVEAPEGWSWGKSTVGALRAFEPGDVQVVAVLRGGKRIDNPHPNLKIRPGDHVLLEANQAELNELITRARLKLTRADRPVMMDEPTEEVRVIEAIIGDNSDLVGSTARQIDLHRAYGVNLLGVSRSGFRIKGPLGRVRLHTGDIVVLQGSETKLPAVLQELDCLPLAEREVKLGGIRHALLAPMILAAAIVLVAAGVLPVAVAFFIAAAAVVATGALRMREAYQALDAPVLILVAALIPVSDTIQSTGGTQLIAHMLSGWFHGLPPLLTLTAMMAVAMAATPFLNNAATVLIVAPIGLGLARQLGLNPDPFLMAVAVGAGCDFLTPIGHQCNTLVFAPGGYRFGDYARLGAPLTLLVLLTAPFLIALFWPLHG
jgi:di/tricarboxylate transporter